MGKFIYTIEKGCNNGYIWVYRNDGEIRKEVGDLLNLFNEEELMEVLAKFPKSAVYVPEDDKELINEGKRLADKLGLQGLTLPA